MRADSAQTQDPSDDHLIARAQDGDTAAFGDLVRRHADRLYAVVVRFTGDTKDAEEVMQEAFVRAWRSINRFERRSQFFTWLYRIAINEAKRHAERSQRRAEEPIEDHGDLEATDRGSLPQASAETGELRAALESAIDELPLDYRVPLVLRDIEGLDTKEASDIMELSEAAFKSRLHRARMAVRETLEPHLSEPSGAIGGSEQ